MRRQAWPAVLNNLSGILHTVSESGGLKISLNKKSQQLSTFLRSLALTTEFESRLSNSLSNPEVSLTSGSYFNSWVRVRPGKVSTVNWQNSGFLIFSVKKKSQRLSTFPGRTQYHRRKRAWLPCSEWERVLPLHYGHWHLIQCKNEVRKTISRARRTECFLRFM